ncbi:type I-E CRISPR-associated protein Cse2/CasB [Lacticaseibacillus pabuli]|uniref:Type I-E CRISPR-associated protein Cse2/CasB n=1 Tax=Lacticaseibacillus pabuli TaxID=3025672 RepID=A0ABY7WZA5_9LACO|nr:type I-E CRISPR-associated protein Cse2/CasB [Lacticaseibacillus sp. KACC 23028]WDF83245.1 type I-E CRISPR-associated protein Cse2/CasB [Lacticaseibacillus sp. KACC 23028]
MSDIRKSTSSVINALYGNGHPDRLILASLRGTSSITSPRAQAVWPVLMAHLDDRDLSKNGQPTPAEIAVFTAVRLYAIHQQKNDDDDNAYASRWNKEKPGMTLFGVLAQMRRDPDKQVALDRRVAPLLATTNITSLINSLTHLVDMVKANNRKFKIDYAELANQLYWFQQSYEQANRVRLQWGQDYYRTVKEPGTNEGMNNND